MGTGITSILLNTLPYNGRWLYWISIVIFCLNIFLFCDLPHNNHPALRALSENLLFDGYPPGSIPLSRNIAYGARYDCQYVLLRLRTGVG
ncbi:C4-dicarboxylate transporter/malic acid transport protein [Penicillium italicum]|uniref:C4-dicarboxylate transporter/malic acid transport protein n=1 Tax=Penicillium italicum TaxID=40296 RepID=A0A0A2KMP1_PENIT|nr:C4-dicarboxylate transporter/malic acid transport protein [Penicillium italicum]